MKRKIKIDNLVLAVANYKIDTVKKLIDAGVDVNERLSDGRLPLVTAARYGWVEIIGLLIDAGADLDKSELGNDETALFWAARYKRLPALKLLIASGADLNVKNVSGNTPLMVASAGKDSEIVKTLVDAGADINVKNKYKLDALAIAKFGLKEGAYGAVGLRELEQTIYILQNG